MSHDRLLHQYIRSSKSPDGQYHVNVPSGLAVVEDKVKNSNTGRFDGVHLGSALVLKVPVVSTDTLFPEIPEIKHIDPRDMP